MIKERANNIVVGEPVVRPDKRWQINIDNKAFALVQKHSQVGESLNDALARMIKHQTLTF